MFSTRIRGIPYFKLKSKIENAHELAYLEFFSKLPIVDTWLKLALAATNAASINIRIIGRYNTLLRLFNSSFTNLYEALNL